MIADILNSAPESAKKKTAAQSDGLRFWGGTVYFARSSASTAENTASFSVSERMP